MRKFIFIFIIVLFISSAYSQSDTLNILIAGKRVYIDNNYIIYVNDHIPYEGKLKGINKDKILLYYDFDFKEIDINKIYNIELSTSSGDKKFTNTKYKKFLSKKNTYLSFGLLYKKYFKFNDDDNNSILSNANAYGLKSTITHYLNPNMGICGGLEGFYEPKYEITSKNNNQTDTYEYSGIIAGRISAGFVFGRYDNKNDYNFELKAMTGFTMHNYTETFNKSFETKHTFYDWDLYLGFNNSFKLNSKTRIYIEPSYILQAFSKSAFSISGGLILYM